ncbi:MAG: tRNA 2-selenouridine(34) synthase MnmH [Cyanobacteria bacterium J06638_20]
MPTALPIAEFLTQPSSILDVRSPAEFDQGHIPEALSFPLFSNDERAEVGTCYKQEGRDAAVELGFTIAGPKFADFIQKAKAIAPDRQVRVHCWRGGMRSGAIAWVLEMAGFHVTTLMGGYKAFRRWVLAAFEQERAIAIIGGMTGTGKTDILHALAEQGEKVLDLEGLANHRGSSFGSLMLPSQPTNEQFENSLAMELAQLNPERRVWIEAESKSIGQCRVPNALFQHMEAAPIFEILRPKAERLDLLVALYGQAPLADLITATERIRKRLGGQRTQEAVALLQAHQFHAAFDHLLYYYDKTYEYDLQRRTVPRISVDATGLTHNESARQLIAKADPFLS